ncbi:MAG: anthranilate synthase component I family protein [Planctomycetia bacterium]|nr:anthranilate synthase component I family protein [Planctomycetia bacterium]
MAAPAPLVSVVLPVARPPAPLEALRRLADRPRPFLRFAAAGPRDLATFSFAGSDPVDTLDAATAGPGRADPLAALARRWPRRVRRIGPRLPFAGGWVTSIGYEVRSAIERTPPPRPAPLGFPVMSSARYDAVLAWDHRTRRVYVAGTGATAAAARAAARRLLERVAGADARPPTGPRVPPPRPTSHAPVPHAPVPRAPARATARPAVPPTAYRRRVAEIVERIRAGDLFQANLSQRFDAPSVGSALDVFAALATRSPAPFLTYLDVGDGRVVVSASPERFLALEGDRAETRPMKGTRPRGATPAEDRRHRRDLVASVKDRAELAMIVDLARNDLGRTCRPGSVRVVVPRRVERYATVFQGVGVVEGRLARGATGLDLVRGAFPPGSVTGAPKVEAMKVIDALEREGRGPYCGAIGWLDDGGDLDLAVAIRTVIVARGRASYRVGGGVTLLSDPEAERVETLTKGAALARALAEANP